MNATALETTPEWWRSAVIYQVYPRSFADASGDGYGDLPGITANLHHIKDLGADAVWLSPFFRSPQRDAGYDVSDYRDVDPLFGTLADADALIDRAHELGLRVIADIVPNHTSDQHAWFQEALSVSEDHPARERYIFRDGKGKDGELPPNNWESVFGGPAWTRSTQLDGTPGQWYLHIFDTSQPDLNWHNEEVRAEFDDILRFWLDRGIDGFRVDVAHGLIKEDGLPDWNPDPKGGSMGGDEDYSPYFGHDGVHEVWRRWRKVVDEYHGRILAAEAWVNTLERMALWVRPDEYHQTFNFGYLGAGWDAAEQRRIITESLEAFGSVGAPSTWVLNNHDVVRSASRLALSADNPQGHGIGPDSPGLPDAQLGLKRARAAAMVMLGLPGSAYIYQGEELGLPEHVYIPDEARQDPTWFRTNGERYGRDGCRVPIPWTPNDPAYGFSTTGAAWLPQPDDWAELSRSAQVQQSDSTLNLYRSVLAHRARLNLGNGELAWVDAPEGVLIYDNGPVRVIANVSGEVLEISGEVLAASGPIDGGLGPDTCAWVLR